MFTWLPNLISIKHPANIVVFHIFIQNQIMKSVSFNNPDSEEDSGLYPAHSAQMETDG